ncbi:hypothetical protein ACOQFO_06795 [Ureibacillus sp. MALMAid1270]|uniref:hypothetical protein n=1 Tax=Ureibacillus sp. MALMAid1270 TaxID=3411629 RepID=UPI003BA71960
MYDAELEAKKLFESLSDEEFVHLLQESGFEVSEGSNGVIYTEDYDVDQATVVCGKVTIKFSLNNPSTNKPTQVQSFPSAC